jgi:hypothetical protein
VKRQTTTIDVTDAKVLKTLLVESRTRFTEIANNCKISVATAPRQGISGLFHWATRIDGAKIKEGEFADFCFPFLRSQWCPLFGRFRKKLALTTIAAVTSTIVIPVGRFSGITLFTLSVAVPMFPFTSIAVTA